MSLAECLFALRTPIVVMVEQKGPTITRPRKKPNMILFFSSCGSTLADLQQALEDYLPVLLGIGSQLQHKVRFVWINQEDEAEMPTFLPRISTDGYQPKVSKSIHVLNVCHFEIENKWASIDILLKVAGYLDCAIRHVLLQLPSEISDLPLDLVGLLQAICLQGHEISFLCGDLANEVAIDSTKATLSVKQRFACEMVKYCQKNLFNIESIFPFFKMRDGSDLILDHCKEFTNSGISILSGIESVVLGSHSEDVRGSKNEGMRVFDIPRLQGKLSKTHFVIICLLACV
ncbi:hypothetical protein UlMin_023621 [Ulmus minor]